MSVVRTLRKPGAYSDSIVLMQLRGALEALPGVEEAGAVMATEANLALLAESGLLAGEPGDLRPDDLLVAVRAGSDAAAEEALSRVGELLRRRRAEPSEGDGDYRPKSLAGAVRQLPSARWVLISVPGRFAARVAREALELGRNVFLYSDNVPLAEEVALKRRARAAGLLVMGPDCGTALVAGVGLGFANQVRQGNVGLVGASGTGLQAITSRIHALGGGVSHALGTGGRDLSAEVGGVTAEGALALLAAEVETSVIVLVSKPPAPAVATRLLARAEATGRPVVIHFLGAAPVARRKRNLHFALNLDEAAELAVHLAASEKVPAAAPAEAPPTTGFLRGLFAGGTLAQEALLALGGALAPLASNLSSAAGMADAGFLSTDPGLLSTDAGRSRGHSILDLGADELTVGRLHPMIDQELRLRRLAREAADPEVGLILLDVVLGHGAHPDPAAELAPAIEAALGRKELEIVAVVVGTDEDPQELPSQVERLRRAGATVFTRLGAAWDHVRARLTPAATSPLASPRADALARPLAAINVGLESFHESLVAQEARSVHVEWRPPAGGDERLLGVLDRMKSWNG